MPKKIETEYGSMFISGIPFKIYVGRDKFIKIKEASAGLF